MEETLTVGGMAAPMAAAAAVGAEVAVEEEAAEATIPTDLTAAPEVAQCDEVVEADTHPIEANRPRSYCLLGLLDSSVNLRPWAVADNRPHLSWSGGKSTLFITIHVVVHVV